MRLAILAVLCLPVLAHAQIVFNPATGTGFAPQASIQSAMQWTPAQYAAQSGTLTFCAVFVDVYEVRYVNALTGKKHVGTAEIHTTFALNASGGAGGFALTGYGPVTYSFGTVPTVGGAWGTIGPVYEVNYQSQSRRVYPKSPQQFGSTLPYIGLVIW